LLREGKTESDIISHDISRGMISMLDKARKQIGLRFEGQ
jgi:scyllo-inositol 2-dehydrogenase (NADP+)